MTSGVLAVLAAAAVAGSALAGWSTMRGDDSTGVPAKLRGAKDAKLVPILARA